jgi:hypothetical protein
MIGRRMAVGLVAAFGLVAAACGDDDGGTAATTTSTTEDDAGTSGRDVDQDVLDRVADAVEATVDEGTARFTVTVETEGTGTDADGQQPIDVEGEVDFDNDRRLITLSGDQGELDVIIDGSTAYLELPATEGDDWMRIDLEALFDEEIGVGGPAAIPFQSPEENLRVLEGSAVHAAEVGEETVGGEDTTRYELVIDLRAAAEESTDDVQEAIDATVERTGLDELEMEVWIDDDDLIRRVAYTLDLEQAEVRESEEETDATVEVDPEGAVRVVFEYSDFGTDVDIELPDDANVVDLDEDAVRDAVGGGGSGSSGSGTTSTTSTTDSDDSGSDDDDSTTTSSTTTTTGG